MLILFAFSCIFELSIWNTYIWRLRKIVSVISIIILSIASLILFIRFKDIYFAVLLLISLYRIVNLLRIVIGRTSADYLYNIARKTAIHLIFYQIIVISIYYLDLKVKASGNIWIFILIIFNTALILLLLLTSIRNFKSTKPKIIKASFVLNDLPSLSVCIPARNETSDLEECIESLLTSSYKKLEILVLDDCSQNKQTPEIIKRYAQDGVRFIGGEIPPENWTAKTFAYEQLLTQASGELILFCGVDTRFQSNSLTLMVETLIESKKSMISFLPVNKMPFKKEFLSLFYQPNRYFWELALPRKFLNRPPFLSTAWLVKKELLAKNGGFKSVMKSLSPESYFAKKSAKINDGYSFIRSSTYFGLLSQKSYVEQASTALRTRYPQMHRRPELVFIQSLIELTIIGLPILFLIVAIKNNQILLLLLALFNILNLLSLFVDYVTLTYNKFIFISLFLMPLALIVDIFLLNYSMYKYEFSEVIWKGRNVCLPVMRIDPKNTSLS